MRRGYHSPIVPIFPIFPILPIKFRAKHTLLFTSHLSPSIWLGLLPKDKVNCQDQAAEACEVVPLKRIALDKQNGKEREDHQRDNLLDNLELPESKWTAELVATYAVGGHLKAVLK